LEVGDDEATTVGVSRTRMSGNVVAAVPRTRQRRGHPTGGAAVAQGQVGIVIALEVTRLSEGVNLTVVRHEFAFMIVSSYQGGTAD